MFAFDPKRTSLEKRASGFVFLRLMPALRGKADISRTKTRPCQTGIDLTIASGAECGPKR
jgi:hypothetical protein